MSRYSVTVKIVQTWYEEIEVEACSEDGAEIIAELENVQATGEPVVDRYVYCNWMIKDTEPTPDEYDAMVRTDEEISSPDSSVIDIDSVLDRPKRSRRRSRKPRSRTNPEIDSETQQLITGDSESTPVEVIISDESVPSIEAVEVSDIEPVVEAPPKRSRNRSRRSRSKARKEPEGAQPLDVINTEHKEFFDDITHVDEAEPDLDPFLAIDTEQAFEVSEPPKKSRNRSRRSRSKARQTAEAEYAQVSVETAPEIIVIEETAPVIEAVEASEGEPSLVAPQKPRSRSRRSRSKPRPAAESDQQQEIAAPESAVIEEPIFVVNAMPASDAEPAVEAPKKPRSRSRRPQPKSQLTSEAGQPQETNIADPEISIPVAPVVITPSIPDGPSAEKTAAPVKKPTTRKRRAPKSSDTEQGPQIGDDSFLGSDE